MISGIAFDRPDSHSHLRAFPDHFKIYMILPIEIVSVIWVICDRLGSIFTWLSGLSEHYLSQLRQSQHSQNVLMTVLSRTDIIMEKL